MEHIAIDLGGKQSQVCVRSSDGKIVDEARVSTSELALYLAKRPASRVVFETCAESFHVADEAIKIGHDVRVVPATLVRALGVGARRLKTDVRDARVLSEASCRMDLGSVHIASQQSRESKTLLSMRETLVSSRTKMINAVRGWARGRGLRIRGGGAGAFHARVRAACNGVVPLPLDLQLQTLEMLTKQIRAVQKLVVEAAKAHPVCARLMTMPGVGPVTALRFVATLDRIERFACAAHVASYLGLVPGQWSSSEKQRSLGITKAGSTSTRALLIQAAWQAWRRQSEAPLGRWADGIAARRGKFVAVVAVARKLAGIAFALWRDDATYDATRAAR